MKNIMREAAKIVGGPKKLKSAPISIRSSGMLIIAINQETTPEHKRNKNAIHLVIMIYFSI
jgi:hypothetical protein